MTNNDESYLSETAREAAGAGWGIIAIAVVIFLIACIWAMITFAFQAPWYYVPFFAACLAWGLGFKGRWKRGS